MKKRIRWRTPNGGFWGILSIMSLSLFIETRDKGIGIAFFICFVMFWFKYSFRICYIEEK